MNSQTRVLTSTLLLIAGEILAQTPTDSHSLLGLSGVDGAKAPASISEASVSGGGAEILQVGDFVPEFGIGCSNGAGTSGGPNEMALGVTATSMPATFYLESVTYNLYTQTSPNITNLQFAAWVGGGSPGATASMTPVTFDSGFNTVVLTPRLEVGAATAPGGAFVIGLIQNQSNVGLRIGVDSSSGSAGTSFQRAPGCGASAFLALDAIGFPGNWVIRAMATANVPVELLTLAVD